MIDGQGVATRSIGLVRIGGEAMGTAWVLDERHVATAAHVIEGLAPHLPTVQPIDVLFPDGPRQVCFDESSTDWLHDAAILVLAEGEPGLPATLPLAPLKLVRGRHKPFWESWGFPRQVNVTGFALSGRISSVGVRLPNGAAVLQLDLDQHQADVLGGASGSPVMVDGFCVGFVIRHPEHLPVGTLFATPLENIHSIASVRAALARFDQALPADVGQFLSAQLSWAGHVRSLTLGTATNDAFIDRTLFSPDGRMGRLGDLAGLLTSSGTLLEGEAGSGKSRFLTEVVRRCTHGASALGFAQRPIPLFLRATDLVQPMGFYERLSIRQALLSVERLRELIDAAPYPWLFVVDALDEAATTQDSVQRLEQFLANLDAVCKNRGHRWIASRRSTSAPVRLPGDVDRLFLRDLSMEDGVAVVHAIAAGERRAPALASYGRLPPSIRRNPLLLTAAVEVALHRHRRSVRTPAHVLVDFVAGLTEQVQLAHAHRPGDLQRMLKSTSLMDITSQVALCGADADEAAEAVEMFISEHAGVGRFTARKLTGDLLGSVLPATGLISREEDKLTWAHALYRDAAIAYAIAERWTGTKTSTELARALRTRALTAVALGAVLLGEHSGGAAILNELPREDGPQLLVDFLTYGGQVDPHLVNDFIDFLSDGVQANKHRTGSCSALLSVAFSPIEALLALSHVPRASRALRTLAEDLFVPSDLKSQILTRLALSGTDMEDT